MPAGRLRRHRRRRPILRRKKTRTPRYRSIIPKVFPKYKTVKLRYASIISLDAAAAGIAYHSFKINGMNDTDATGVGHQPLGWDEWKQFYNKYTVLGAKCNAYFYPPSNVASEFYAVGIKVDDNGNPLPATVTSNGVDAIIENSFANNSGTYGFLGGNTKRGAIRKLTRTFSTKKFFNVKNLDGGVKDLTAAITADPTDLAYFNIWYGDASGADASAMDVYVVMDYIVRFSEPFDLGQS